MRQSPIKRSRHIFKLSKDHHFTLLFSWKIRRELTNGVEVERIKKYVQYFWYHDMQPHFREEDEILFAAGKDEMVQKAMEEHRQIKEQTGNVLKTFDEEELSLRLLSLADAVDAHVRYEERKLFPHLEQTLTEMQLETIGQQLESQPVVHDIYEDEFWVKEK